MEVNVTDSVTEEEALLASSGIMTVPLITGEAVSSLPEGHTIINLPFGKDGTLLNAIPTSHGFVIATGPDGAVYLDAEQMAMLTQNAQMSASFEAMDTNDLQDSGEDPVIIQDILQLPEMATEQENIIPREREKDTLPEIQPPVGKGPFHCELCGKVLIKWNQLQRHLRTHADDKPHRCDKCEMSFNVESNLTLHRATHNPDDLSCPECGKTFKRVASLKSHLMLHEKEESLVCPECSDEFTTQTHLSRHMKIHREPVVTTKLYLCKMCNLQFNRASELRVHMKAHYRIKASLSHRTYKRNIDRTTFVHACPDCNKQFQKPSQLVRHSRIHTGERPYGCEQCGKTFNQKGALQIHQTKHSGLKPFKCDFCSATFSQRGNLRSHIQRVHVLATQANQTLFECEECPCVFRKLGSLNAHFSRMHSREGELVVKNTKKPAQADNKTMVKDVIKQLMDLSARVNIADRSGKDDSLSRLGDKLNAQLHSSSDILQQALQNSGLPLEQAASGSSVDVHGGSDKDANGDRIGGAAATAATADDVNGDAALFHSSTVYKDASTGARSSLVSRKVAGVRWHQCLYCIKVFRKPSDLVRHIRIHTHEKPFKCNDCFRSFTVKSTLTAHLRTHTGLKEFGCQSCFKMFSTQGSLNVHARLHTGAKPFRCQHCDRQFRTSGHLKNHLMSHLKTSLGDGGAKLRRASAAAAARKAKQAANASAKVADSLSEVRLQEPIFITGAGFTSPLSSRQPEGGDGEFGEESAASANRPFECCHCGRRFKKSSHLKQHLRSHTGEKPYSCSVCDRKFVSGGVLTAHMKTHQGVKVHCTMCDGSFTTNGSLKRHMSTHSEIRPFMCPYCQKTFKTSVNCKKHMKTHRQELAEQAASRNDGDVAERHGESGEEQTLHDGEREGEQEDMQEQVTMPTDGATVTLGASTLTLTQPLSQECLHQLQQSLNQHVFDCQNQLVETVDADGNKTLQLQPGITFDHSSYAQSSFEQFTSGPFTIQGDQLHSTLDISNGIGDTLVAGVNGELISTNIANILPMAQESCETQTDDVDQDDDGGDGGGGGGGSSEQENEPECELMSDGKAQRRPYTCMYCIKRFKKSSHLKQHIRTHTGEKPYKCLECNRMFVSSGVLRSHAKIHTGVKDYKCSVCDSSFTTNGSLTRHFLIHSSLKPFKCSECGELFRTSILCRRHIKTHTQSGAYYEPEKSLTDEQSPRKNRSSVLLFSEAQTEQLSKQPPEECTTISEKILIASAVEKDRVSEIKDRHTSPQVEYSLRHAHECDVCRKSFKKPSDLVRHLRIHTGEKPFKCNVCQKKFTVKSTLDSHIKIHDSETKNFNCHVCQNTFATKGSLKVHMRLHTGAKPFKCPHCELRFRTSGHRKSHIQSHNKPMQPKRRRMALSSGLASSRRHEPRPSTSQQSPPPESVMLTTSDEHANEESDMGNVVDQMDGLLMSAALPSDEQQSQYLQLSEVGTSVQLHLTSQSMQFPGLDTLTRTIQIDANLLQQLQQQGHLSLTINGDILTQGLMVDTDMGASLLTVEEQEAAGLGGSSMGMGQATISLQPMELDSSGLGESMVDQDEVGDELRATEVNINITESGELVTYVQPQTDCEGQDLPSMTFSRTDDDTDGGDGVYLGEGEDNGVLDIPGEDTLQTGDHVCGTCNKTFTKPNLLQRHQRIHTRAKPYRCSMCAKTFNQSCAMQVHERSHCSPNGIKCLQCPKIFTQKGNLAVHVRRSHPQT